MRSNCALIIHILKVLIIQHLQVIRVLLVKPLVLTECKLKMRVEILVHNSIKNRGRVNYQSIKVAAQRHEISFQLSNYILSDAS